jgi:hypothetical protein
VLCQVQSKSNLDDVLFELNKAEVLSAPIIDEGGVYHGMISCLDILRFLYHRSYSTSNPDAIGGEDKTCLLTKEQLEKFTVDDVLSQPFTTFGSHHITPESCVSESDNLAKPARMFQRGYHR